MEAAGDEFRYALESSVAGLSDSVLLDPYFQILMEIHHFENSLGTLSSLAKNGQNKAEKVKVGFFLTPIFNHTAASFRRISIYVRLIDPRTFFEVIDNIDDAWLVTLKILA